MLGISFLARRETSAGMYVSRCQHLPITRVAVTFMYAITRTWTQRRNVWTVTGHMKLACEARKRLVAVTGATTIGTNTALGPKLVTAGAARREEQVWAQMTLQPQLAD